MIGWVVDRLLAVAAFVASWLITPDSPNFILAQMATGLFLLLLMLFFLAFGSELRGLFISCRPFRIESGLQRMPR